MPGSVFPAVDCETTQKRLRNRKCDWFARGITSLLVSCFVMVFVVAIIVRIMIYLDCHRQSLRVTKEIETTYLEKRRGANSNSDRWILGGRTDGCVKKPPEEDIFNAYTKGTQVPYAVCAPQQTDPSDSMAFNNCCLTITDIATPDPFVIYAFGRYYMTFTSGDKVEIWSSPNLLELGRSCQKTTVWRPPPHTHYSGGIWAPELHALEGRWYIYVAAEDPKHGNKSHRMYVLGGPPSNYDPAAGPWEFLGPIAGMPDHWAIDGTILPLNGKNYFVYSGWPFHNPGLSDLIQEIFIIELASPTRACSQAVSISQPNEPWERSDKHGINEGPQVLIHPDGQSWVGIAYSCAGSWTRDYKVNTLHYLGGDPLSQSSWRKAHHPLLQSRMRGGAPYGPGHGSFLNVSGDTVSIYHATDGPADGWNNRKARIQRVRWTPEGPWMGEVGPLVDTVQHYLAPGGVPGFPGGRLETHHELTVEKVLNKAMGFLKKF